MGAEDQAQILVFAQQVLICLALSPVLGTHFDYRTQATAEMDVCVPQEGNLGVSYQRTKERSQIGVPERPNTLPSIFLWWGRGGKREIIKEIKLVIKKEAFVKKPCQVQWPLAHRVILPFK